ncbi:MAG: hypothetical protein RL033_2960 [Pseudomonadota bacterium]|jgi:hypothetical protein
MRCDLRLSRVHEVEGGREGRPTSCERLWKPGGQPRGPRVGAGPRRIRAPPPAQTFWPPYAKGGTLQVTEKAKARACPPSLLDPSRGSTVYHGGVSPIAASVSRKLSGAGRCDRANGTVVHLPALPRAGMHLQQLRPGSDLLPGGVPQDPPPRIAAPGGQDLPQHARGQAEALRSQASLPASAHGGQILGSQRDTSGLDTSPGRSDFVLHGDPGRGPDDRREPGGRMS